MRSGDDGRLRSRHGGSEFGCTLNGVTDHGQNPAVRLANWHNGANDYSNTDLVISGLTLNYRLPLVTLTSVSGVYWYYEFNYDLSDPTVLAQYGGYDAEFIPVLARNCARRRRSTSR